MALMVLWVYLMGWVREDSKNKRELFDSGATNIDGTKQPKPTPKLHLVVCMDLSYLKDYAMKNGITDPTDSIYPG